MDLTSLPIDDLLRKQKRLRRELRAMEGLRELRVAILGGSTTNEIADLLELQLLASRFRPVIHQAEYGGYYTYSVLDPSALVEFKPDIVYVHTSYLDIEAKPTATWNEADFESAVATEMSRYRQIWDALEQRPGCQVIQNNFDLPPYAPLGNMDAVAPGGMTRFVLRLNAEFAAEAARRPKLFLQDVQGISGRFGSDRWFDWHRYFSYKILQTPEANAALAQSLGAIVNAAYGLSRKVLVLDLDNTLWGGVIGDDGADRIVIGRETPVAEAYTAFQEYCLGLRSRGVLLAVCSKNNDDVAREGFAHPDSVLKLEHISCFKANWSPKHENIVEIAAELNLGVDSFVFVDDNPAERAIVRAQVPGIAVPEVGDDVTRFASIIDAGRYFEPVALSKEDLERAVLYAENSQRAEFQRSFANYGEYLDSLQMAAEIDRFKPVYLERIAQLTNKTNQFNLTTRRYTLAEMEEIASDPMFVGLYGRLTDRFGDNGLISIVLGRRAADTLHLDLWLMSCRVLKRDMEVAMLDAVVEHAREMRLRQLVGYYLPTKKNGMVADHYKGLGFELVERDAKTGASTWQMDITLYETRNRHIKVMGQILVNAAK